MFVNIWSCLHTHIQTGCLVAFYVSSVECLYCVNACTMCPMESVLGALLWTMIWSIITWSDLFQWTQFEPVCPVTVHRIIVRMKREYVSFLLRETPMGKDTSVPMMFHPGIKELHVTLGCILSSVSTTCHKNKETRTILANVAWECGGFKSCVWIFWVLLCDSYYYRNWHQLRKCTV